MIIIPAIDLKEGKCVRLRQGRMDSSTIFNDDPVAQAKIWEQSGAARLHVVDLDGSIDGSPVNLSVITSIINAVKIPVQLGGGVRTAQTIRHYIDSGIRMVIVGTVAARFPELAISFFSEFPGQVAVGIDAVKGIVSVEGWTQTAGLDAIELGKKFDAYKPASFIYTDIERDGMMKGPNFAATRDFAQSVQSPVILSGGVTTLQDVKKALDLEGDGVSGVIIGRALYERTIDLGEAIGIAEDKHAG